MPLSVTVRPHHRIQKLRYSTSMLPLAGVNFIAFTSTFDRTCSSLTGSPYIAIPGKIEESDPVHHPDALFRGRRANVIHGALKAGQ